MVHLRRVVGVRRNWRLLPIPDLPWRGDHLVQCRLNAGHADAAHRVGINCPDFNVRKRSNRFSAGLTRDMKADIGN